MMHRGLPHIFGRVFNTPLAMPPARLEPLIAGLRAASAARGSLIIEAADPQAVPQPPGALDIGWKRADGGGYLVSPQGVAWLPIRGIMTKREGEVSADSTELESYARVGNRLRAQVNNPAVRAIMLDIDSPGGEVGGLFDLAADIRAAKTVKPVWAIANDDALSAGYAIASAAGRVWATSMAGLGSIGVVAMHTDQSAFDAARGAVYTYIYAGARKIDGNSHAPLSDDARGAIQAEVDRIYGMFVDMAGGHRGLSEAKVRGFEAGVFYGPDAVKVGLADEIGTFAQAVAALGREVTNTGSSIMTEATNAPTGEIENTPTIAAAAHDGPTDAQIAQGLEDAAAALAELAEGASVVSLDAVRTATGHVRREAAEIAALCDLAGMGNLAADFIAKETPLRLVRDALQRRKAEADEARQIETIDVTPKPAAAGQSEMQQAIAARFASQMGRKL